MSYKEKLIMFLFENAGELTKETLEHHLGILTEIYSEAGLNIAFGAIRRPEEKSLGEEMDQEINSFAKFMAKVIKSDLESSSVPTDDESKTIGDTVKIVDTAVDNYLTCADTGKPVRNDDTVDIEVLVKLEGIVVNEGLEYKFNCGLCDELHTADVVVYFPKISRGFYVPQNLIKVVD